MHIIVLEVWVSMYFKSDAKKILPSYQNSPAYHEQALVDSKIFVLRSTRAVQIQQKHADLIGKARLIEITDHVWVLMKLVLMYS